RLAAGEFMHLEAVSVLAAHIKPVAIPLGRDKHAIVTALDDFGEVRIKLYHRATARELRAAEILEPMLWTLHAMEYTLRSVGERHHSVLRVRGERAKDNDVALEVTGPALGVAHSADDAGVIARITEDACVVVRCANHAM